MRNRQARDLRFYGEPPTGWHDREVLGRIVVFEGPDGAGRSTHIRLIKEWLEDMGLPAVDTGLTRSDLAGRGIDRAKTGHRLDAVTLNL
ncbi:MAG: thymidylate kinase, partial [Chloroflexi bacterium]|nr:thymidylate kinase [Chloroflexota bacterium]